MPRTRSKTPPAHAKKSSSIGRETRCLRSCRCFGARSAQSSRSSAPRRSCLHVVESRAQASAPPSLPPRSSTGWPSSAASTPRARTRSRAPQPSSRSRAIHVLALPTSLSSPTSSRPLALRRSSAEGRPFVQGIPVADRAVVARKLRLTRAGSPSSSPCSCWRRISKSPCCTSKPSTSPSRWRADTSAVTHSGTWAEQRAAWGQAR